MMHAPVLFGGSVKTTFASRVACDELAIRRADKNRKDDGRF